VAHDNDSPAETEPYRVLARKYRPQSFDDLIGQEAMVTTLANAFETGRIAQAYMLTGVRGVGKTTTARIIARALNYATPGAAPDEGSPTIRMPELGEHCRAIMESRHVDVIEMDAASNTGIDDIREIIESARYRPASARYKVYIIDEVHMLSKAAFNGLLKTLEEPPPHVKFVFATTEVRKVPVTVLSRCQRFDLRRIDSDLLVDHFGKIAGREGAEVAEDALVLIARAAEGSVRDGLSLLDQAIALGRGEQISADQVRDMLGLADRARTIDLLDHIMKGDVAAALTEFKAQHDAGADPAHVLVDLAQLVHWLTRLKIVAAAADDPTMSEAERTRGIEMAQALNMRVLARAWQMLLKGIDETNAAHNPGAAADMVLVRLCHVSDLPAPEELVRRIAGEAREQDSAAPPPGAPSPQTERRPDASRTNAPMRSQAPVAQPDTGASAPALDRQDQPVMEVAEQEQPQLQSFADLVALAEDRRDLLIKSELERFVRPVSFRPGHIEINLEDGANPRIVNDLAKRLRDWTGERWVVALSQVEGEKTIYEEARARETALMEEALRHPVVAAALETFPGAKVEAVRAPFDTGEVSAHTDDDDEEPDF